MRLLKDVVLVLLAPDAPTTPSGLILAPSLPPPPTYGRVRQVGPRVTDVKPGDLVAFASTEGEPLTLDGYAHLLLRESAISLTVERTP